MTARMSAAWRVVGTFGWYPPLLVLTWFLEIYGQADVAPAAAFRPLLLLLAAGLVVTVLCIAILGRDRGSLLAAIVLIGMIAVRDPLMAIPFLAFVPLLLVERRWTAMGRLHVPWPRLHEALSVLVAVMFLIQAGSVVLSTRPAPALPRDAWASQPFDMSGRPDIFVILTDAHGRQDVLDRYYGYDDSTFLASLESNGLTVSAQSRSNYDLTRFSLASMFTSSYLDQLNANPTQAFEDAFAEKTIHDNPTFGLLDRVGYQVTVVSSGYEHLGLRGADNFVDTGQLNEFESVVAHNISASSLLTFLQPDLGRSAIRERTSAELAATLAIAASPAPGPRFVYTHLPVPHWPFVFAADCSAQDPLPVPEGGINMHGGSPDTVAATARQTMCVDRLLSAAIRELVGLVPNAVILVVSDHGPDEHLDWWQPDAVGIDERSGTLFAARTPGHPGLFADNITLVNVMPTLLNAYLGTSLPTHDNQFWFGPRPQDGRFVQVSP